MNSPVPATPEKSPAAKPVAAPMRGRRRLMRQTDLVERVLAYDPDADEAILNKAYVYAMTAHGKQFRASGDPYFAHPLEVAAILTDLKLDVPTIVTALLHDTIEDTLVTYEDIKEKFGDEIANLVDGVTKPPQLEVFSERTKQAENFRKLMLAITSDIRVLLVKLADRLHKMRPLGYIDKPDKRRRIAQETVDIYAPLAGRIGMQNMREEREDLAFAELDPEARNSIVTHFARLDMVGGDRVGRIADQIKRRLAEHGMEAWVYGRGKRPFSIWRKLQTKKLSFEQLSDLGWAASPTRSSGGWPSMAWRPGSMAGASGLSRSGASCRPRSSASSSFRISGGPHRRPDQAAAGRAWHGGLGLWPGQAAFLDLAQAADQEAQLRAAFGHFRLPRHR